MEQIGLIDIDGTLPNLALMKTSAYFKSLGVPVEFVQEGKKYSRIYASAIFSSSKAECMRLREEYGDRLFLGGTAWDIPGKLPKDIEQCPADYSLYTADRIASRLRGIMTREAKKRKAEQIVSAGIGFSSRGCIRCCPFCLVPQKEGAFRQDQEIRNVVNPRSNVLILQDNNFTADPYCLEKLKEIEERKLVVDINQGLDIRLMTDEIAAALERVRHLRSLHYAWDLMNAEQAVIAGIRTLSKYIRPYRQMCFMLVGFNTSFEQDVYRFRRLLELGVKPYVMVYNNLPNPRLKCFERWVNGHFFRVCTFEDYEPWRKLQMKEGMENEIY